MESQEQQKKAIGADSKKPNARLLEKAVGKKQKGRILQK
jgi:hypothetical protein